MQNHQQSDRLSWGDTVFLHLEREGMPLNVASVCLFEGEFSLEDCAQFIESKLPLLPRYLKRVVPAPFGLGLPSWEYDPEFDLRRHVREVTLKHGTDTELKALAGKIFSQVMDRRHPLWDTTLVRGLKGNRTGLIIRMHHCLADGIAGVGIINVLLDASPEAPRLPKRKLKFRVPSPPDPFTSLTAGVLDSYSDFVKRILSALTDLVTMAERAGANGESVATSEFANLFPEITAFTERLRFNVIYRGPQKFAWAEIPLAEVKAIRHKSGTSINDVILALVTATIRRYCELHGDRVKGKLLRIMVPVNLRGSGSAAELGNRISLVPVTIPLDIRQPRKLLAAVHKRTEFLKGIHAAELVSLAGGLIGMFPTSMQGMTGPLISQLPITPFNMVCTNVPGPQSPLYLLGRKMLHCYPYVPVGGEMAVNCAILSYNGTVYFGFSGDAHVAPDLKRMEKLLEASFTELRDAAGIRPSQKKKVRRKTKAASTAAAPKIAPAPVPAPVAVPIAVRFSPSESKRAPEAAPATEQENIQAQLVVA
ncbi:MAG TPA: wax ester/triacylglycerol synthase family O-acyltransferase [Candidatus Dormibacteraeota bacterium]|nr:wax ester/triacylglycerol synthase family O-acyltransferase [Candidatus Dormibacteraeota bacterium]